MRADWTAFGACTSGLTAHPRGATRRACGGAATTSTTRAKRIATEFPPRERTRRSRGASRFFILVGGVVVERENDATLLLALRAAECRSAASRLGSPRSAGTPRLPRPFPTDPALQSRRSTPSTPRRARRAPAG